MTNYFIMMVGLSYSGKSTLAKEIAIKYNGVIHSSDAIRKELYGDANIQTNPQKIFQKLGNRVVADLKDGKNVIYDATNLNFKRRVHFLKSIEKIPCKKICVVAVTSLKEIFKRKAISTREVKVPEKIIYRQLQQFTVPYYYEGWDDIRIIQNKNNLLPTQNLDSLLDVSRMVNHNNPHHSLSIGLHMDAAATLAKEHYEKDILIEALQYHDIGKLFTETKDDKGVSHYYNHQFVSAYTYLVYKTTVPYHHDMYKTILERDLYIAVLIQFHMELRLKKSQASKEKFKALIGNNIYKDLSVISTYDVLAH